MGSAKWAQRTGLFLALFIAQVFCLPLFRDVFVSSKFLILSFASVLMCLGRKDGECDPGLRFGIAFLGIAVAISSLFSLDYIVSALGPHGNQFYAIVPLTLYSLLFWGVSGVEIESITEILVSGSVLVSAFAFVQVLGCDQWLAWSIQGGRAGSTFGSPIFLGSYLAAVLPVAWGMGRGGRKIGYFVAVVTLIALMAAKSRGGIIAGLAGVAVFESWGKSKTKLVLSFVVATLALMMFGWHSNSDGGRIEVFRAAVKVFKHYPILGSGPDTFGIAFRPLASEAFVAFNRGTEFVQVSAHNDFLQVAATLGLFGLFAYLFFLIGVAETCYRSKYPAMVGSIVALFVQAKFNPVPSSVMAIGAIILGSIAWRPGVYGSRIAKPLRVAIAMAVVAIAVIQSRAEHYQMLGELATVAKNPLQEAEYFNRAAKLNKWDIFYTQMQLDHAWKVIPILPKEIAIHDILIMRNLAYKSLLRHPNDAASWDYMAVSLIYESYIPGHDTLALAARDLERAHELAPTSLVIVNRQVAVAIMRKDRVAYNEYSALAKRLEDVKAGKI